MPENNNVTTAAAAEKQYIVKIGSAPKPQVWNAEKYERNKDALFEKYGDTEVYESTPYNGEAVNAGDAFSVYIPGTEQGQIWDADKYARDREALVSKYPGAEVKRVSPVDYWGEQRAQLDSLDSQIAELEGTTKEAQDQWNLLRYNEFEKGSDEEVAAGVKAKNLENELDELCRKRENNPVYKKTKKAIGTYLETMHGNVKSEVAALNEKYAPEIEASKNLFSGSREAAIARLQMPAEYTTDSAALQAARMYYDDAIKVWNAPSRYGKESGFANFFKGLIGEAPEALSVVQLAKAIGEGAPLIEVVNKIHEHEGENVNIINLIQNEPDKLDYLSPAQKSLLNAFVTKSSVDAARSNDLSLGYQAGQTAMKSLGFMADFLLTGGIGDAVAKGATKGIIKGVAKGLTKIENGALRTITKEASKFGIGTFQSGVKTLAISGMMPSTYANVINNLTSLNNAGDVDLSGRAVTNAIGDALIENLSESAGTQVEAILGMPFRAIGATGAGKLFANTEFGAWAKALKNAPAGRIMKQAAWNGLIGEIGEEWYGNALRVLTGVDPDALKNFATAEQQIITWASFAPMSILGGGASIAQYEVSNKQLDNAGKYLRQALANAGYDEAIIDNVLAAANAENPTELARGLAPVIVQTANDNMLQSNSVFKAVLDYAGAVSKYRTYGGFMDADMSEKRQAMSDEISAGMGVQAAQEGEAEPSRPWVITRMYQVPDGSYVAMNSVRVVTDKDGVEYFVQSESEDGSLAAIDRQGNPHIISSADLVSGTMLDTGEMPLNDYLDRELTKRRLSEDEERVQSEFNRNRQNLLSQAAPGTPINLGTVETPKRGTIIAYQSGKFIVQDENGVVTEVSEEQMSHILDVPYNVETEEEAIVREVSDIERKEELRTKANAVKGVDVSSVLGLEGHGVLHSVSLDNDGNLVASVRMDEDNVITKSVSEDELTSIIALGEQNSQAEVKDETEVEVASENGNEDEEQPADDTLRDFHGNPLPMRTNKKGEQVVDEIALWNNDPEAWCHYNDANPEQIVTSVEKLEYAEKELAKQATAAEKTMKKAALKGTTQDELDDLRDDYNAKKDRLAVIQGILAEYKKPAEPAQTFAGEQRKAEASKKKEAAMAGFPGIQQRWSEATKIDGAPDELTLANGEVVVGHYVLTDAMAMTPSHNPAMGFAMSDGFPVDENGRTVNDRDYERDKGAQNAVNERAKDYDQRALQTPVIVSNDGVVLSGNDRTMSSQIAALAGTDSKYVNYLSKYSQKYGFTMEQVATIPHPRVVFVPDESMEYTASNFAKFNADDKKSQNKTEKAVKAGKTISPNALGKIATLISQSEDISEFYADAEAVDALIGIMVEDGIITKEQVEAMKDGARLSGTGMDLVEAMLVGSVLDEEALRVTMKDAMIRKSVVSAIAQIITNNAIADYTLRNELSDAIVIVFNGKSSKVVKYGDSVQGFVRQGNLFGDDVIAEATVQLLADAINNKKLSLLRRVLDAYNSEASLAASGQIDLFTGDTKSKAAILTDILNNFGYDIRTFDTIERTTESAEGPTAESAEGQAGEGGQAGDAVQSDAAGGEQVSEVTPESNSESSGEEGPVEGGEESSESTSENEENQPQLEPSAAQAEPSAPLTDAQKQVASELLGMSEEELEARSQELQEQKRQEPLKARAKEWEARTGVKVNAISSVDEVTNKQARKAIESGETVFGWFEPKTGTVCLYLPHVPDESEIDKTYIHEVVSHKGLRELLGEEGFNSLMDSVWNDMMSDEDKADFLASVSHVKGSELDKQRAAADEFVASYAENLDLNKPNSKWDKFVEALREILAKLGISLKINEKDLSTLLQASLARYEKMQAEKREDEQGNPLNEDGTLKLEKVNSIDELTDEDFTNPTRSVELPVLPKNVDAAIGANGKPVIIKRNIFKKNKRSHSDLSPEQSRDILKSALYNPDLYGQNQKTNRPYNWVVINTVDRNGKNRLVLLEVADNKDNVEIINWHFVRDNALNTLKRQAEREGGLILILPSESTEEAGGLSSRPSDVSSEDKDSEKSTESNTSTSEETSQPTEAQKDVLGRIFGMSPEAVEKDHKARKSRKKDNEQGKKIEDFGEKIAGARKDRLRELSKNLEDATEESFVALALSKAFKRPNTKKLVEEGVLSPEDATFVDAISWLILGSPKPLKIKGDRYRRYEAERRDQEILEWAKQQAQRAGIIHEYINADEAGKKAIINNLSHISSEEKSSVDARRNRWAELNKGWNDVKIGELYPLNPEYVAYRVFQSSGYDPDVHGRIKFPIIKCDSKGNYYTIAIEKSGSLFTALSVEDALSLASYFVQLQFGEENLDHPTSVFKVRGIRDTVVLTGRYRVYYIDRRGNLAIKEFQSKDAAIKFAKANHPEKTEEELLSDSTITEIEAWADPTKFKIVCTDVATGETYELDTIYNSKEDAAAAIDSNHEELNSQFNSALQKAREAKGEVANKKDRLYVAWYSENGRGSYGVFAKDKNFEQGYVLFSGGFETSDAARTYMEEHRAEYEKLLEDMAEQRRSFVFFDGDASPRSGKDYRHGKDVGEEEYKVFGFRGVQFGNWTNNADRQAALNNAYDAFMDLANILGVSPAALSLNGELGLAFGARGSGSANAHYEANEVVINLSKTRGAGSLAHEWWHALDNYFARHGGIPNGFLTESYVPGVRHAVRLAFEKLTDAIRQSDYGKRSSKKGAYWGSPVEATARLFAEWVDRKMAANGESNHFLVRGVRDEKARDYEEFNYAYYATLAKIRIARDPNTKEKVLTFEEFRKTPDALAGFGYPTTKEINATFGPLVQEIFDTIEEKSEDGKQVLFRKADDNGDVTLYRRGAVSRIEEVNGQFNEKLETLNEDNADGMVFNLGMPSDILRSAGIADMPMKLYGNKILKKMRKHGFGLSELKDLPKAVASPIAVFNNYGTSDNRSILTELRTADGNFLVTLTLGRGIDIDFNIVTSLFGKGDNKIINWFNSGYATYIDKEKALNYLYLSAPIAEAASNSELSLATKIVEDFENPTLPEDDDIIYRKESRRRAEMNRVNGTIDNVIAFVQNTSKSEARAYRQDWLNEHKRDFAEICERALSGNFDSVTLGLIDKYINDATPKNPYGRRISQRVPQAMERGLYEGARTNAVDALFTRVSESSVRETGSPVARDGARRAIEEKKELLRGWAVATGNWHTSISDFTNDSTPVGSGKDSDVYASKDGDSVIKVSKGKDSQKKFRPDIDAVNLFNYAFPNGAYEIVGYGEIDGKFVKFLKQPIVDFAQSAPLTEAERVSYMEGLGFHPINKERTAFSNGVIAVADLQKSNIVKDKAGNVSVIDADVKLHTKDFGGSYTYPDVSEDFPDENIKGDAKLVAAVNSSQKRAGAAYVDALDMEDDILFRMSKNTRATVNNWVDKWGKAGGFDEETIEGTKSELNAQLDAIDDATTQLAFAKWFCSGRVRLGDEDMAKVEQAVKLARNHKVDPLSFSSPMEIINKWVGRAKEERIGPDTVSTLHKAKELSNGIVIYDVDESDESRENMRKIINTHFGKDCSPWCLLQGDRNGNLTKGSKKYWKHYNAYPKQVVFKNGKLVAFSANDSDERVFWDREDYSHKGIPVVGKIEGDKLGRSGVTEYSPKNGKIRHIKDLYKGNTVNGEYIEYFNDSDFKRTVKHYKNGRLDGKCVIYKSKGIKHAEENYKDGIVDGECTWYYSDGGVSDKGYCKDGKLTELVTYNHDGIKVRTSHYKNGVKHGEEIYHYPDGSVYFARVYENGDFVEYRYPDEPVDDTRFRRDFTASDIAEMETPILQSKGTFKNLEEAEKWAKANLQGKEFTNQYTRENIRISGKSISEMLAEKFVKKTNAESHKAALRSVPDFIETGIPAEVHPDYHGKGYDIMRLYSAFEFEDELYRVKSTIKRLKEGDRYYTYELQEMELVEGTQASAVGLDGNPVPSSINSISGAKLLKGVKKTNSDELILPEDEDNTRFRKEQIHTKQFKDWFGDWEKAVRIGKLRNSADVSVEYNGEYALDPSSAQKWIKDNLRGEYPINDTGEIVSITKVGAEEVTSHSRSEESHLKSIAAIPQMLENAIFIEEVENTKNNGKYDSYRYYVVGLDIDGEKYTAKIVVGVKQGKKYYDHRLTQVEKTRLIDNINQPTSDFTTEGNESLPPYIGSKDRRLISILQTDSSKVVDESGEPLVVYHGSRSTEDFGVFDGTKSPHSRGTGREEAYFFSNEDTAAVFASDVPQYEGEGRVVPAYLSIKNPARIDYEGAIFSGTGYEAEYYDVLFDEWTPVSNNGNKYFPSENLAVTAIRHIIPHGELIEGENIRITERKGVKPAIAEWIDGIDRDKYDGAVVENIGEMPTFVTTDYVAFRPDQIKSATENNGDFSGDNPDIRFRRRGMTVPVQGEDESDIDFAQRCIDRISYTYNTVADSVSVSGVEVDRGGEYDPSMGKVTIFAKPKRSFFVYEDAYFHENLHAFIDKEYNGAKEEISEFYENARLNHPRGFDRCVPALRDLGYAEETLPEELFVYTASKRLANGALASDMHFFTLGVRNIIEEYTNRIGYDINEEERLRSVVPGFSDRLHLRDSVREEAPERRGGEESEGGSRSEAVGAKGYTGDGVDWRSSSLYQREVLRETARVIGVPMELVQSTYESPAPDMVDASGRPIISRWNKGRVQICPNLCRDANDAACTYIHEAVGHSGLSSVFDQNQRRKLYLGIYNTLPDAVRREVADKAVARHGGSVVSSIEEFLSNDAIQEAKGNPISIIEDSANPEEYRKSVWNVVRDGLTSAFGDKGLEVSLSLNDAKWLMAQSAFPNHESNPLEEVTRQVVANHLGFTRTQQAYKADGTDALRFRRKVNFQSDSAAEIYDRAVSDAWGRLKESYVDMYQSVEEGVKAIEQTTGRPAQAFENVLLALNQQSSKALATMQRWQSTKFAPMMTAIVNLANAISGKVEDVERYVMLKHGLERNEVFAKRDALDFYQRAHDEAVKTLKKSNLEDSEKAARIAAEDAKLDMHRQEIDNGTDEKYLKLRKKDYSGLTGMYMEQGGNIQRDPSETDLEFTVRLMKARYPKFVDANGDIDLAAIEGEARAEVDAIESAHSNLTNTLWGAINAATSATLQEQYEANLLSREQYVRIRDMFKYYVPLRGFDDKTSEDFYSYYAGSSHSGYVNPIMHAEGRKSKAESPFGYIAAAESTAVAQGSKNMTKLALYYFVSNRANNDLLSVSDVWYKQIGVDQDDKPIYEAVYPNIPANATRAEVEQAVSDFEDDMKRMAKAGLAFKGKNKLSLYGGTLRPSSSNMEHEHVIPFKLAGRDMMLIVHGNPRMAQAFTGALNYNAEEGVFTKICQEALRFMASLNTQMNPEFWISNFQRDLLFSMMAVNVKEDKDYQRRYKNNLKHSIKNVIKYKKAYEKGALGNSYEESLYRQFVENGGVTGYTVMHDNAYWERRLKEFAGEERNVVSKIVNAFKGISDFGESFEQMTRFAAFCTSVETGKDIREAIADAKNLTVNFNRKGSGKLISYEEAKKLRLNGKNVSKTGAFMIHLMSAMSPLGRRCVMFFNAAIQGLSTTWNLAKTNPAKMTGWSTLFVLIGAANAALHAMLDDDDDYLDIPDFERRNNAMLGYNGAYLKWALPQEMRVFYGLGDMMVDHMLGRSPDKSLPVELLSAMGEVLPINPVEGILELDLPKIGKAMVPSAFTPILEIMVNEDYKGARVHNDYRYYSKEVARNIPKYRNPLPNTSKVFIGISEAANFLSGGDDVRAGWLNFDPNNIEHLFQGYTGGFGTAIGKGVHFVENTLQGEFAVRDTPFLRRLLVLNDERYRNSHTTDLYYYYKGEVENTKRILRDLKSDPKKIDRYMDFMKSEEYKVMQIFDVNENLLEYYDKEIRNEEDEDKRRALMQEQDAIRKEMILEISEIGKKD